MSDSEASPSAGEFDLIARLTRQLPQRPDVLLGVGDDCAVLDLHGVDTLATCDSQVEGIHFRLSFSSPEQIGQRALAVNLSDIAAMGGEPRFALVSLLLPPHLPPATLDGIYSGLRQEAEQYATAIVGGNIASSQQALVIDITLLGAVEHGRAFTRSGAHAGDTVMVTGSLGSAAAGLYTLLHSEVSYMRDAQESVRQTYRTPQPRVHEGRVLNRFGPETITSSIDISDGLSGDLRHLCERSNVGARIELERLPLSPAQRSIAASAARDPYAWALQGGEDYELLFTVAPGNEQRVIDAVRAETGTPVTPIGVILPGEQGMRLLHLDGREEPLNVESWDHLRPGY